MCLLLELKESDFDLSLTGFDDRAATHPLPLRATVAICTRERPDDLDRALAGVAALDCKQHDVLVVDNAPETDRTRTVVSRWPHVRYVREDRRGLDAARNRALHESTAHVVAFTDDDAVPEPELIASLLANFQDPRASLRVLDGLQKFMAKRGLKSLKELIGKLQI